MSELKMASGAEGKGGSFQKEGEEPEPLSGAESETSPTPELGTATLETGSTHTISSDLEISPFNSRSSF